MAILTNEALRLLDYGHKLGVDGWMDGRISGHHQGKEKEWRQGIVTRKLCDIREEREHGRVQPSTGLPIG